MRLFSRSARAPVASALALCSRHDQSGCRMSVIAVFSQKGGVGKTTTALNLCAGLAQLELDPVAIDLDPQGHLTLGCGVPPVSADASAYAHFERGTPLARLARRLPS